MLKLIRRHQKKLLAVFTAGLMIVFVADVGIRQMNPVEPVDPRGRLIGRFGDSEVRVNDIRWAEQQLQILDQVVVQNPSAAMDQRQFFSLWEAMRIPPQALQEWAIAPITFALLKEEAGRMPAYVSQGELDGWMNLLAARLEDGRTVALTDMPDAIPRVRASLHDLLLVVNAFDRTGDVLKVSRPFIQRSTAEEAQQLTVSLVRVSAEDLLDAAPEPTDAQLREFFDRYADASPDAPRTEANPLGFGYRYPPRVKLQYVQIPQEPIRKLVRERKDDYAWELDANRYYLRNQREFAMAPPAPTTAPATEPSTQPTTRPFDEVREEILDKLMAPEVQKLSDEIRRNVHATMTADYKAWAAASTTAPAAADSGAPYDSYEYLEKLAASIQSEFDVLPSVASIGEWKSEPELATLPGIGRFSADAFDQAAPLATTQPARNRTPVLRLYEPSQPLADASGNGYVYRLTGAEPAHAPADPAEVREQLVRDWKLAWAWDRAKADAEAIAQKARESGLDEAAGGFTVVDAGPFQRFSFAEVPGLDLPDMASRARFINESFKLVSDLAVGAGTQQHPVRLIDLPQERVWIVAQLAALENLLSPQDMQVRAMQWPILARGEWEQLTAPQWFSYGGVTSRLKYTDAEATEGEDPEGDAPADRAASLP